MTRGSGKEANKDAGVNDLMTIQEASARTGLTDRTVRRLVEEGTVPGGYRFGKSFRIRRTEFEAWFEQQRCVAN